jgi:hypothetical protein
LPHVAWEDPRTTGAMLGMAQRPESDARRPPVDADFDALIAQLERRALAGATGAWMRDGPGGEELVLAFALDRELTAAIKRLPGRRFDSVDRTLVVPAVPALAAAVEALLADHPWLTIGDDVEA